jgi:hypothetical protein
MVRARQRRMEIADGKHLVESRKRRRVGASPETVDTHPECRGPSCHGTSDLADAHDQDGLTLELSDLAVRWLAAPFAPSLRPQQSWEAPGQRDHHAQHVLRHVRRRYAARVRQHDSVRRDLRQLVALDASARGMHPAQAGCDLEQMQWQLPADQRVCIPHVVFVRRGADGYRAIIGGRVIARHDEPDFRKFGSKPGKNSFGDAHGDDDSAQRRRRLGTRFAHAGRRSFLWL